MLKNIPLIQLKDGRSAKVVQILGGHGISNRLNAIGVVPGKRLRKISSMLMRGPVTVEISGVRLAFGFGMASKIIVEE